MEWVVSTLDRPRTAHIPRPRPYPGYPAPDQTTTSMNSHIICTDPQLLIKERPEACKSIQEKRDRRGFVCCTFKAGLSTREREREETAILLGLKSR